jgi:tetratricopeptide (TPR) repeat protein
MKRLTAAILSSGVLLSMLAVQTKPGDLSHMNAQGQAQTTTEELSEAERLITAMDKLYGEGKYDKALAMAKRIVEIRERAFGADHPLVTASLNDLAVILISNGKYDEAEKLLQRVIAIREKTQGPRHHDLGTTLGQYACLLWSRGRSDDAKKVEGRFGEIYYDTKPASEVVGLVTGKAIKLPPPRYPDEARQARMLGTIVVWISIDETGKVVEASGRCSIPSLVKASETAAYLAVFKPTLVEGKPTKVKGYITYNFVRR